MLTVLTLMSKVVFSPLWLLWQLYNGLWWAFQDDPKPLPAPALNADAAPARGRPVNLREANARDPSPRESTPRAAREPSQGRSFEVMDSSAKPKPTPRPLAALRGGFFGSVGISVSLGYLANLLVLNHWLDPARAASAWLLSSAFTLVASLFAVRAAARRDAAQKQARISRSGFIRRTITQNRVATRVGRLAHSPEVAKAAVFARANASRGAAACATSLRQGISSICSGLSKVEAKLGVPKTAAATPHHSDSAPRI